VFGLPPSPRCPFGEVPLSTTAQPAVDSELDCGSIPFGWISADPSVGGQRDQPKLSKALQQLIIRGSARTCRWGELRVHVPCGKGKGVVSSEEVVRSEGRAVFELLQQEGPVSGPGPCGARGRL